MLFPFSVAKVVRFSQNEAKANFENFGTRSEKNFDELSFQSIMFYYDVTMNNKGCLKTSSRDAFPPSKLSLSKAKNTASTVCSVGSIL